MIFLSVTLLTFVQFLWVLLWIGITLVVLSILAGFYLYYRKHKMGGAEDPLSPENEWTTGAGKEQSQTSPAGEKAYQGLLWLKGKYEEDIEQADTKFYELREEFKKLEKKYIDLRVHSIHLEQQLHEFREALPVNEFHSMSSTLVEGLVGGLASSGTEHLVQTGEELETAETPEETETAEETGMETSVHFGKAGGKENSASVEPQSESLVVKQSEWETLQDKLVAETLKVKDLESRLASSSQLLMKMYKELASSLQANNTLYKSKAQENRVKGLVKEFDAVAATAGAAGERKISSWVESPAVDEDGQLEQLG